MTSTNSVKRNGSPISLPTPLVRYHVKVIVDQHQSLYHASYFYTGLWMLAERGVIRLEFLPAWCERRYRELSGLGRQFMEVSPISGGEPRLLCIDCEDRGDLFCNEALKRCDIYFKRSFHAPDVARLPAHHRGKVVPFGMIYACRCPGRNGGFLRALGRQLCLRCRDISARGMKELTESVAACRAYWTGPCVGDFECDPNLPLDPVVVFQTRTWEADDTTDNAEEVNEGRVRMVRCSSRLSARGLSAAWFPLPWPDGAIPMR